MNIKKKDFRQRLISLVVIAFVLALLAPVLIATPANAATTYYVATTGSDATGDGSAGNPWQTIQYAVNNVAVTAGDTINVAAGTYIEQVVINKSLTLTGNGNPTIQAPASPSYFTFPEGPSSNQWEPVVFAFGGTLAGNAVSGAGQVTVNISRITVDGNSRIPSPTSRRAVGILYRNVLGGVNGCTVQNMGYLITFGNSWGIMAYGTSDVTFESNNVSGYAKGGFVVNGVASNPSLPKPNAVINDNTVTGPPYDPALVLAPNGIQIGWGATGSVTNNTVTHHGSPGTVWGGTGILIQSSPDVIVEWNTVTNNQDYGIATSGYTSYGGSYATGTTIQNNTVEGNGQGVRIEKMSVDTLVQNNTITGNEEGIHVGSAPLTYPIPPVGTVIHNNIICFNTDYGLFVETDVPGPVNAENNWWGNDSGPDDDAGVINGTGDKISINVDADPWQTGAGSGSVTTATSTGTATLASDDGAINDLAAVAEGDLPTADKPSLVFTHGFFSFTICCLTPGQTVTVNITLPSAVPVGTQYWKYGPTLANPSGEWYQILMGSDDGDNVITIQLQDGGIGDDDLVANGVIVDQGGPGNPPAPRSVGGIAIFPLGGSHSSSPPYVVIIGGALAALGALALGVCFARRQLLRRSN